MISIKILEKELYDEANNEFIHVSPCAITLEHSLMALSKWEQKWHKPFISKEEKTYEETMDYIRCMTVTKNVDPNAYYAISQSDFCRIEEYIKNPSTATWFSKDSSSSGRSNEIVTAEIIYYWMIAFNIPESYEKWHLNKLLTLIEVCNRKNQPPKKISKKEILERNRKLNAERRKKHPTPNKEA